MSQNRVDHRRLIISGSGVAGLSAAIYAARSNNDPLVLEGDEPGGQLTLTTDVENFPGFPDGISGPELINNMKQQARKFGADVENGVVETVDDSDRPFHVTLSSGEMYTADAVIVASGASARTLGIPGEDEMIGYGLSTCATCDGAFFRGEDMLVVGGGDAAMEEANFLTKFADTVYIAHRRENFRAEDVWVDRTMDKVDKGDIELLLNTEAVELHGTPEDGMDKVTLVEHPDGHPTEKLADPDPDRADEVNEYDFDVGAVFYAIGHTPNTEYLEQTEVELDDAGYLQVKETVGGGQSHTGVEGIFGAGDVVDFHYQQAVTAGGSGCKAALDADEYLSEIDHEATPEAVAPETDD